MFIYVGYWLGLECASKQTWKNFSRPFWPYITCPYILINGVTMLIWIIYIGDWAIYSTNELHVFVYIVQEQSTEGFSKWAILHILHVKWNMRLQDLLCYNAYCLICTITNTYLFITFIILLCTAGHVQHVFMFLICFYIM